MNIKRLVFVSVFAWLGTLVLGFALVLIGEGKAPFAQAKRVTTAMLTDKSLPLTLSSERPAFVIAAPEKAKQYLATMRRDTDKLCASKGVNNQFACYLLTQSPDRINQLSEYLISSAIPACTPAANKNDAWRHALMFDSIRSQLSNEAIQSITNKLETSLFQCLEVLDGASASLWHGRFSLGAEAFIVASVLYDEGELLNRSFYHFNQSVLALTMTEGWPGGYNYWIQNRGLTFYLAVQAYIQKSNDEVYKQQLINLAKRNGRWHIYMTRPDDRIQPTGDEGSRTDLKEETQKVIHLIAKITQDPVIATFADYIDNKWGRAAYYPAYAWLVPLVYDGNVEYLETKDKGLSVFDDWLPNHEIFGRQFFNQIVLRTGWGENDTFVLINGGDQFSHHQHADAGHFTYFANGRPIVVDGAYYSGILNEERLYYGARSTSKNVLSIESSEANYQPTHIFKKRIADGSQRLTMPHGSAVTTVDAWLTSPNFHRAELLLFNESEKEIELALDLSEAYFGKGSDEEIIRTFEFTPHGELTIRDTINNVSGSVLNHLNLATQNQIACSGSTEPVLLEDANVVISTKGFGPCAGAFYQQWQQSVDKFRNLNQKKGREKAWFDSSTYLALQMKSPRKATAEVVILPNRQN